MDFRRVAEIINSLGDDITDLLTGQFELDELSQVVQSLVIAAETVIDGPKTGEEKTELVLAVFSVLDDRYGLIRKIDDQIHLPRLIESIDGPIIELLIRFLISMSVQMLNKSIWKEDQN